MTQIQSQPQAPECKPSPIEKLEDKERKLTEQLKAIQLEIKTKKQRQAAIETNRKRKEHTRNAILLGLALADLIAGMLPEKRSGFADRALTCFKEKHAPGEDATDKIKEKFQTDCEILKIALDRAAKGEAI